MESILISIAVSVMVSVFFNSKVLDKKISELSKIWGSSFEKMSDTVLEALRKELNKNE